MALLLSVYQFSCPSVAFVIVLQFLFFFALCWGVFCRLFYLRQARTALSAMLSPRSPKNGSLAETDEIAQVFPCVSYEVVKVHHRMSWLKQNRYIILRGGEIVNAKPAPRGGQPPVETKHHPLGSLEGFAAKSSTSFVLRFANDHDYFYNSPQATEILIEINKRVTALRVVDRLQKLRLLNGTPEARELVAMFWEGSLHIPMTMDIADSTMLEQRLGLIRGLTTRAVDDSAAIFAWVDELQRTPVDRLHIDDFRKKFGSFKSTVVGQVLVTPGMSPRSLSKKKSAHIPAIDDPGDAAIVAEEALQTIVVAPLSAHLWSALLLEGRVKLEQMKLDELCRELHNRPPEDFGVRAEYANMKFELVAEMFAQAHRAKTPFEMMNGVMVAIKTIVFSIEATTHPRIIGAGSASRSPATSPAGATTATTTGAAAVSGVAGSTTDSRAPETTLFAPQRPGQQNEVAVVSAGSPSSIVVETVSAQTLTHTSTGAAQDTLTDPQSPSPIARTGTAALLGDESSPDYGSPRRGDPRTPSPDPAVLYEDQEYRIVAPELVSPHVSTPTPASPSPSSSSPAGVGHVTPAPAATESVNDREARVETTPATAAASVPTEASAAANDGYATPVAQQRGGSALAADDMLPMLIYALSRGGVNNLVYMREWISRVGDADECTERAYYFTMFASAIEYIRDSACTIGLDNSRTPGKNGRQSRSCSAVRSRHNTFITTGVSRSPPSSAGAGGSTGLLGLMSGDRSGGLVDHSGSIIAATPPDSHELPPVALWTLSSDSPLFSQSQLPTGTTRAACDVDDNEDEQRQLGNEHPEDQRTVGLEDDGALELTTGVTSAVLPVSCAVVVR